MSKTPLRFTLICAAAIVIAFGFFDLSSWIGVEGFRTPFHPAVLGDQDYYLARIHRAAVEGRPVDSAFYFEHLSGPSRFPALELPFALMGRAGLADDPALAGFFLRIFAALGLFAGYRAAARRWSETGSAAASAVAAAIVLFGHSHQMLVGSAINSWLLPLSVLAACAIIGSSTAAAGKPWLSWACLAVASASVHPVMFAVFGLSAGLAWLTRFIERRDSAAFRDGAIWLAATIVVGSLSFGGHLAGGEAAAEALRRTPQATTRLPATPVESLLMLTVFFLLWTKASAFGTTARSRVRAVSCIVAACFLGSIANVFSGTFFLNTHFFSIFAAIMPLAAMLVWRGGPPSSPRLAAVSLGVFGLYALGVLLAHPWRSWLVLGRYLPLAVSLVLLIAPTRWLDRLVAKLPRPAPAALVLAAFAYSLVFQWRLERPLLARHADAQSARPLFAALASLPAGVVMADADLSGLISIRSRHLPYWYRWASTDTATDEELLERWRDMLTVLPDAADLRDQRGRLGVFHLTDSLCGMPAERLLYAPLVKRGSLKESLCVERKTPDDWNAFADSAARQAQAGAAGWSPSRRLDYLIIDKSAGESVPAALGGRFESLYEDGRYRLFRYRRD
jgi:hypothetical protein